MTAAALGFEWLGIVAEASFLSLLLLTVLVLLTLLLSRMFAVDDVRVGGGGAGASSSSSVFCTLVLINAGAAPNLRVCKARLSVLDSIDVPSLTLLGE